VAAGGLGPLHGDHVGAAVAGPDLLLPAGGQAEGLAAVVVVPRVA
jgi:hypothetical protein